MRHTPIFSPASPCTHHSLPTFRFYFREFPLLVASLAGLAALPSSGQGSEGLSLARSPGGKVWNTTWQSAPGKTYFLQHSSDLVTWEYDPKIYCGNGQPIHSGFLTEGNPSLFVRQISTDQAPADAATADFDQDGFANIVELQHGSDPFNASSTPAEATGVRSETVRLKLLSTKLSNQALANNQILSAAPTGSATVALSGTAAGEVSADEFIWSGGASGSYRGFLSQSSPSIQGRSVISTVLTTGQGDMNSIMGFTQNGALNGVSGNGGMSLILQRTASNNYNRIVSTSGSGNQWIEMTQVIELNTQYRTMVRKEDDGFSSWIQGGLFANMGAIVNSSVWFPIARWKGVNPTVAIKGGIYNSWAGPVRNSEFSDIENPPMDSTSALLDYERNKNGLHVPSLLLLPDRRLLAVWQNNTLHASDDCVIKMAVRDPRGAWGPASTILSAGADGQSNNGPVLNRIGDEIWLTYHSGTNEVFKVRTLKVEIDENSSISLGTPQTMFESGVLLNHMLTLPRGRIVTCWHTASSNWKNLISYSDDGGVTWTPAAMPQFTNRAGEGFAIVEADGTLASYWRTDRTAIYRSTSNDDGATWTALAPTAIPCANMATQGLLGSRVCGYKRPSDGKVVIIGNNSTTQREKLTVWLINNGKIEGTQSVLPWDVPDGSAEGIHYPDIVVEPDDSMTIITARWLGGGFGSSELHSAINTFKVKADFK